MEGQQFESSLIKNLPKSGVLSVPTPIEEMNPVVLVKYDGIGEEKKLKCFLLEVLGYQDTDAREKQW